MISLNRVLQIEKGVSRVKEGPPGTNLVGKSPPVFLLFGPVVAHPFVHPRVSDGTRDTVRATIRILEGEIGAWPKS